MDVIDSSRKPVIISSSLTSLLISLALSRRNIDHILVYEKPARDSVKVGESINQTASLDFWKFLGPEFESFFCTKNHISLLKGDSLSLIYLGNPNRGENAKPGKKAFLKFISKSLIHVNRTKLEQKLLEKILSSKYCLPIIGRVKAVKYDKKNDEIDKIKVLSDRQEKWLMQPKFVFDGSGKKSTIPLAAQLSKHEISSKELVIWSQIKRDESWSEKEWWDYGTNLLKLEEKYDGISGIAWLIPVGDYYSVGVSINKEDAMAKGDSKEMILDNLLGTFQQKGIKIKLAQLAHRVHSFEHSYYYMSRAYGSNWLLAGSTFMSIWFPSSAGVAVGMAAAHIAPLVIDETAKYGEQYETSLKKFIPFHWHIDSLINKNELRNNFDVFEFWKKWINPLPDRLLSHVEDHYASADQLGLADVHKKILKTKFFTDFLFPYAVIRVVDNTEGEHRTQLKDYFSPVRVLAGNIINNVKLSITKKTLFR